MVSRINPKVYIVNYIMNRLEDDFRQSHEIVYNFKASLILTETGYIWIV